MRFWLRVSEGELPDRCNGDGGGGVFVSSCLLSSSNALMANISAPESRGEFYDTRQISERCDTSAGLDLWLS